MYDMNKQKNKCVNDYLSRKLFVYIFYFNININNIHKKKQKQFLHLTNLTKRDYKLSQKSSLIHSIKG